MRNHALGAPSPEARVMDSILLMTHDAATRGRLRQNTFILLPRMGAESLASS
jgi:hypothetical protein